MVGEQTQQDQALPKCGIYLVTLSQFPHQGSKKKQYLPHKVVVKIK